MSKEYRKSLGFNNANSFKEFLTAKDIQMINWPLIESYNKRLEETYSKLNSTLPIKYEESISDMIEQAYQAIKNNNILESLNNHGRANEAVYYVWMQGYLTANVFKPFIENKLDLTLSQNGADDLTNPKTFSRKSDPDLVDHNKKVFVEVQAGFKGGKVDIKKTKVKATLEDYTYYIFCIDNFNGRYCYLDARKLLELPESSWYANPQWEGALCYTIPDNLMTQWFILNE